jgi:hypothetical protein
MRTTWACPNCAQAIAAYTSGLHRPLGADRIAVTSSGVTR